MKNTLLKNKIFRYLIVGGINTLVGTGLMFGLYNLANFSYWPSSGLSYFLASILSFFLNKHFTFKSQGETRKEVLFFALNIAVCYFIAYGLAQPLVKNFIQANPRLQDNIALAVGMVLYTILKYLGQNFLVFK